MLVAIDAASQRQRTPQVLPRLVTLTPASVGPADGGVIFSYYPDEAWLERSRFLHCDHEIDN